MCENIIKIAKPICKAESKLAQLKLSYEVNLSSFSLLSIRLSKASLHRTVQLQLLQHYWSGNRLGLL